MVVLAFQVAHFLGEGIPLGLGPPPMGRETQVALLAPVREVRRVETLAAKQGPDRSGLVGRIGLCQDALLIFSGELATLGGDDHLGVGQRFGFTWRCAAFGVASLGLTPLRARRNQN